jgi:hypothetical protein
MHFSRSGGRWWVALRDEDNEADAASDDLLDGNKEGNKSGQSRGAHRWKLAP